MPRRGLLLVLVAVAFVILPSCQFFNSGVTLTSISVSPAFPFVVTSGTQQFTATGINDDGSTGTLGTVTWDTGDHSVATITGTSITGTATAVIATGTGPVLGHTTVTATSAGLTGSTTMSVTGTGQDLQTITVDSTPTTGITSLARNSSQSYAATGHFLGATPTADISNLVQWTSDNTNVATVDSSGKVTAGNTTGTVTITATAGSVTGHVTLSIT